MLSLRLFERTFSNSWIFNKNTILDVNIQNIYEDTGGHYAYFDEYLEILKFLIKYTNLDINIKNNHRKTGFQLACFYGHFIIVEFSSF